MNPKHRSFKSYGGKGVRVCTLWQKSYEQFLADMGERPARRTLDRIDPRGHYTPENCRWATARQQRANRRDSLIFYGQDGRSLKAWVAHFRADTGDRKWTQKTMRTLLEVMTFEQIVGAFHPQRRTPMELEAARQAAIKAAQTVPVTIAPKPAVKPLPVPLAEIEPEQNTYEYRPSSNERPNYVPPLSRRARAALVN